MLNLEMCLAGFLPSDDSGFVFYFVAVCIVVLQSRLHRLREWLRLGVCPDVRGRTIARDRSVAVRPRPKARRNMGDFPVRKTNGVHFLSEERGAEAPGVTLGHPSS